jgi:uncharacterized protein (DUF1697 family)
MARQIALLRGVNLGRNKRLSMADLRELMHALGYRDAKTLLQSGNVVYTASEGTATAARRIKDRLARDAGIEVDVIVRTRSELEKVVARNPLRNLAMDPKRYFVVFLSTKPKPALLRDIDPAQFEPERFQVSGKEVYIWLPKGMQNARLTHAFWEKSLDITATSRNWSTVEKLLTLADSSA